MIPLTDSLERFYSVGVTFRTAPSGLRDRLTVAEASEAAVYEALRTAGVGEALLISTCDRVELFALAWQAPDPAESLSVLARYAGVEPGLLAAHAAEHRGGEALRHLFAIAAALDSQVVGEPQVLGQVKAAHERARRLGASGPTLDRYLAGAYQTAKQVRSESRIGEAPVSLAAAATKVARTLHGDLGRRVLLLVGLGELGELLAEQFQVAGIGRLGVLHKSSLRAHAAAGMVGGQAWPSDALDEALESADIVILSQGSGEAVIGRERMARVLRRRRGRPVLLLDVALPRDLGPGVEALDDAFVYDLADLERLAADGQTARQGASLEAWRILGQGLARFQRDLSERSAAHGVTLLRGHADALRREILAEDPSLDAEAATALLLQRLLHRPSEVLRHAATDPAELAALEEAMRRLFLPEPPATAGRENDRLRSLRESR